MSNEAIERNPDQSHQPWKRIGDKKVEQYQQKHDVSKPTPEQKASKMLTHFLLSLRQIAANLFLSLVHISARLTNRPLVDIGQKYSVATLNDRINMLEEILVKQWTNLKEDDFLTPNEEIKQYIAACHVARQYDRITEEMLAARLGISGSKATALIDQLIDDEVVTEGYSVTFHDIRRSSIDAAIDQKLRQVKSVTALADSEVASPTKKH